MVGPSVWKYIFIITHMFETLVLTQGGCLEHLAAENHTNKNIQVHALLFLCKWMGIIMQLLSVLIQIDYQTFLTLSEDDLKEVGVSTFGARRKMLLAITGENLLPCLGLRPASPSDNVVTVLIRTFKLFIFLFRPEQEQEEAFRHPCGEAWLPGRWC